MSLDRHHPARASRHGFRALTSPAVALDLIRLTLDLHPDSGVVALVEDRRADRGMTIPVQGEDPEGELLQALDDVLTEALAGAPDVRVVLASVRPSSPHRSGTQASGAQASGAQASSDAVIHELDVEHWRRLLARHVARGVELLDWFVLTGRRAMSLAEIAGPPARWRG